MLRLGNLDDSSGFKKKRKKKKEKKEEQGRGRADSKLQGCGGFRLVGVERDLRLRADVSVDDDGCSLLKCRVVIMRDTCSLLSQHTFPLCVRARVCACMCLCVCMCVPKIIPILLNPC